MRGPFALLVRQRTQSLSIPQLGLSCDAGEFPILNERGETPTYWSGICVFHGAVLPYPLRGAGAVIENTVAEKKPPLSATFAVSTTTMFAILTPTDPGKPAIWLGAPIAQLNIAPDTETSGFFRKKPLSLTIEAVGWKLSVFVTKQIAPETRRKSGSDAQQMLAALGGAASGRARPSRPGDRPMVALCAHGAPSADVDSVPALDASGGLFLEAGEDVLWTGTAGVVTTSATAARGKEVFGTMWTSADRAARVMLTSQRLVYLVSADAPHAEPITHPSATTIPVLPPHGATAAGHIRHANVAVITTGSSTGYSTPDRTRITATLADPGNIVIQVHLLIDQADRRLADAWVRAAAGLRLASFPELELQATEKWDRVAAQASTPTFKDGHNGIAAVIPLYCQLGDGLPR